MEKIGKDTCIVRNTAGRKGRHQAVVPGKTAMKHLHYGRIILDAGDAPVKFDTKKMETGLICLKGSADVRTGDQSFTLNRLDSLYVPRDASIEVKPGSDGCDLAEIAAPVDRVYPVQFVPYRTVQQDPGLHLKVGSAASQREVDILIGKNVEAGRLLAGVTFSQPGNWTSWPPHEHAAMLEEAYLYIDMPAPSYGVQLVYTDAKEPELATIVREGDVVLMPAGYHPNVAAPGGSINFLWMMAANRERDDRQYGVVNVQPDFAAIPVGIDKGR
ncbi:MAG TPA: 5-deoxy-glucuronate isomerase [Vicinamibacterales bacterium]|jgi:5-deoxy-glucuronate isomerase|nr:5-deoxy-glucuronate isomerase [Vicinamibacterales bacterium]